MKRNNETVSFDQKFHVSVIALLEVHLNKYNSDSTREKLLVFEKGVNDDLKKLRGKQLKFITLSIAFQTQQ